MKNRTGNLSPQCASKPLASDVARLAGVSPATVDRVLNRRAHVRGATAERVIAAARSLRYLPEAELYAALRPRPMRLTFILPAGSNRYLRMLGALFARPQEWHRAYNVSTRSVFVESFNPAALAEAIRFHASRADGIAFMALDHDLVREAARKVADAGKPVLTLISDLPESGRAACLGLDNQAAGRTAALLIGQMAGPSPGKVGLIAGSRAYLAHADRERGFRALTAERFPHLAVVELHEGHDETIENYRAARQMLLSHPGLAGIYNIGGSPGGVARAIREMHGQRRVIFVGHALTADSRQMLLDGSMDFVLNQSPEKTLSNAVRIFTNLRAGRPAEAETEPLVIDLITRENLPAAG